MLFEHKLMNVCIVWCCDMYLLQKNRLGSDKMKVCRNGHPAMTVGTCQELRVNSGNNVSRFLLVTVRHSTVDAATDGVLPTRLPFCLPSHSLFFFSSFSAILPFLSCRE